MFTQNSEKKNGAAHITATMFFLLVNVDMQSRLPIFINYINCQSIGLIFYNNANMRNSHYAFNVIIKP